MNKKKIVISEEQLIKLFWQWQAEWGIRQSRVYIDSKEFEDKYLKPQIAKLHTMELIGEPIVIGKKGKPMKVWTDANPKMVAYLTEAEDGAVLPIKDRTIAEAEYIAVIFGLARLIDFAGDIEILCDREHVPKQLAHEWHIRKDCLRPLANKAWKIVAARKAKGFETTFTWIPREENRAGKMLK